MLELGLKLLLPHSLLCIISYLATAHLSHFGHTGEIYCLSLGYENPLLTIQSE